MENKQENLNFDENDIEEFDDFIDYYGLNDIGEDDPKELNFESNDKLEDDFIDDNEVNS